MPLKRREFLLRSAALAAAPLVARAASLAAANADPDTAPDVLASAQLIWCEAAVPVPITGGSQSKTPDFHCVFAKEIDLPDTPTQPVLLHLFAFTRYRLYVNGAYIGRGPCRYQNQHPEYDTIDIRSALKSGRNLLAILVHRDAPTGRIMRHDPGFIAVLQEPATGKLLAATDATWFATPELSFGPRGEAWASIGENIDARKSIDWTMPDLTQPVWRPAIVLPRPPELRFYPRSTPRQLEAERSWSAEAPTLPATFSAGSEVVFTLPEIAQVYHLLEMDATAGSSLEVRYGLPEGQGSGAATYIARDGRQTWMSGDTFAVSHLHLFVKTGSIRLLRATAFEVRYPFERAASFTCSDPALTQLWSLCARSLEVLSEDSYVDCAERERVEWTDDSPPAFDCTRVMMRGPDHLGQTHWADARLLGGLLRRIALTQQPDGQLKAHSCSERFDIHAIMEDRSFDWVVQLRAYYESCNDAALVRELWPVLDRLLDWNRRRLTPRGLLQAREWGVWDNPLRYQVCEGTALNAMLYRALVDASFLAGRLGRSRQARELAGEAERLQAALEQHLWNEQAGAYDGALFGPGSETRYQLDRPFTGKIVDGRFAPTVQGNLFALYSGIVPPHRVAAVRSWVLAHLDDILSPMAYYYLFHMLYEMQDPKQDALVLDRMRLGWKNQIESPWQLSWETLEKSGASRAHIYGMHPGYFLTAFVLGARRVGPVDQRRLLIEPRFSGLASAKGICVTEFGPVAMQWSVAGNSKPELDCTVPKNTHATLRLRDVGGVLEIDGSAAAVHRSGVWLEVPLSSGNHSIKFHG